METPAWTARHRSTDGNSRCTRPSPSSGGVAISVSGCDSDSPTQPSPTPDPDPTPDPTDVTGTVTANHGHDAVITSAQLTALNMISLDIRGSATHSHTVELTADEVMQIADGARVTKDSETTDGAGFGLHLHTVTFN